MPILQVYHEATFMPANLAALQACSLAVEVRIQNLPYLLEHTFLDDVRLEDDELEAWEERFFPQVPGHEIHPHKPATGVPTSALPENQLWMAPFPADGLARRRVSFSTCSEFSSTDAAVQMARPTTVPKAPASALHRDAYLVRPRVHFEGLVTDRCSGLFNRWALQLHAKIGGVPPSTSSLAGSKEGSCRSLASSHPAMHYHRTADLVQTPVRRPSSSGQIRPPTAVQLMVAEALPLAPRDLTGPMLYLPISEGVGLLSTADQGDVISRFSVFDVTFHAQTRARGHTWSLIECVADAVSCAGTRTRAVQVLRLPLPDMPEPQVVLTPASAPPRSSAVPLDLRNFGFSILTFAAEPGQSVTDVFAVLQAVRNGRRSLLSTGLDPSAFVFQDARGRISAELQDPVSTHEWVKLVPRNPDQPLDGVGAGILDRRLGPAVTCLEAWFV